MASQSASRHDIYDNPLVARYASQTMCRLWSARRIHTTWRRLWVALAEAERELGLGITETQIAELKAAAEEITEIDFERAAQYERELRHDVMAHVHAYRDRCPNAGGIIHLGATSCYVTDNTDLILMREGLEILRGRLVAAIDALATFAAQNRDLACLGFTHLQPAQPTTVGKRATLWCYDLVLDLEEVEHRLARIKFRGARGPPARRPAFWHSSTATMRRSKPSTGGWPKRWALPKATPSPARPIRAKSTRRYWPRCAESANPPTKRGPTCGCFRAARSSTSRSRRSRSAPPRWPTSGTRCAANGCARLARFAISLAANGEQTAATQWLERTLDDSANRRLSLPQAFLAIDAVLILYRNIVEGLVVHPKVIEKNLRDELPFMATEEILMAGVRAGGDRQVLHERIRVHSQEAARRVKDEGEPNDLIDRLKADPAFAAVDFHAALDARQFVGRAPQQVDAFVRDIVEPIRIKYASDLARGTEAVRV